MTILWDDVRYLDAIEAAGSVGSAARTLGVSASTVYRRVGALEAAVGYACLVRGAGESTLTETGLALARAGRGMRVSLARVAGEVRARESAIAGEVSLTTVDALLPFLVDPIAQLTRDHPLRVTLLLGDSGPSVRDREVDVAIGIMRRPPSGCWGRRLGKIPFGVFGTREAIARKPAPVWVTRSPDQSYSPEAAWEREHVTEVAARAHFDALVVLVSKGVGIGLVPRVIASLHPELVELPAYRPKVASLDRTAWLLTHADLRKTPRVAALMEALTARFRGVL